MWSALWKPSLRVVWAQHQTRQRSSPEAFTGRPKSAREVWQPAAAPWAVSAGWLHGTRSCGAASGGVSPNELETCLDGGLPLSKLPRAAVRTCGVSATQGEAEPGGRLGPATHKGVLIAAGGHILHLIASISRPTHGLTLL